jgi:Transposase DDE domain group 1
LTDDTIAHGVLFSDLFDKPLVATFDQAHASSDGGAIVLKAADQTLGLIAQLAATLQDGREEARVTHPLRDLLAQRIFGLACGHADANDADGLADDPIHKLLLDRDPITGGRLASQPTLSRFENAASPRGLFRLNEALTNVVIARHRRRRRRVRRITLDLDVTADETHGAQQLSFFSGCYGHFVYLPLLAFVTFDDEPRQYLVAALLRPGNVPATTGVRGVLKRLLPKLWAAFPRARLRVRLDGGFAAPETFELLETAGAEYVVAMGKNDVLKAHAEPLLAPLRETAARTGETATTYGECVYQAQTWTRPRRTIIKAEVVCYPGRDPRDNPRFVVTNLRHAPQRLYGEVYAGRGDSENRLKELHQGLDLGRTSCSRFWANQLRVTLTAAAYVLMQELQLRADRTPLARAQVPRLRLALLKIGGHVVRSVRRLVIHLPRSHPDRHAWCQIAQRLGATTVA